MRYVWMVFVLLVLAMVVVLPRLNQRKPTSAPYDSTGDKPRVLQAMLMPAAPSSTPFAALRARPPGPGAQADSIVAFGLAQRGTPYVYAGTSPVTGFDCSGFIMYTFARFGVAVPHSTALLIGVGQPVDRAGAQRGDIVVFTGTDSTSTSPGHAGIVISGRGEVPLRFVHSSSARRESGVKVSQVEGTGYERRFMQVRRVLGASTGVAARRIAPVSKPAPAARAAVPVASLPLQEVELARPELATTAPPVTLKPTKLPVASKKPMAKKSSPITAISKTSAKKSVARKPVAKKNVAKKPVAKRKAVLPKKPSATSRTRIAPSKK